MAKHTLQPRLKVVPLELAEANELVARWHRHHQPVVAHRFSLGIIDEDGLLHGACIVSKPVARLAGDKRCVLEVLRLVVDGTPNCCSALYAAAARAGKAMGYERIQTYILDQETGTSLKASGWVCEGTAGGGDWSRPSRPRTNKHPVSLKQRWALTLNKSQGSIVFPTVESEYQQHELFGGAK